MADPSFKSAAAPSPHLPPEDDLVSVGDRTRYIDRCHHLLADRRRRFCLYHLHRANTSLSIRHLAGLVEAALAPPGAEVTERVLDDAVRQLADGHLPELREVGLLCVNDGYVSLEPDATLRIQEWLSTSASVELDSGRGANWIARARKPSSEPTHVR